MEILKFIISKSQKYGGEDFKITKQELLKTLHEDCISYEKADYIMKYLGYQHDINLFQMMNKII